MGPLVIDGCSATLPYAHGATCAETRCHRMVADLSRCSVFLLGMVGSPGQARMAARDLAPGPGRPLTKPALTAGFLPISPRSAREPNAAREHRPGERSWDKSPHGWMPVLPDTLHPG